MNNLFEIASKSFERQAEIDNATQHCDLKRKCNETAEPSDIARLLNVLPFVGLFTSKENIALGVERRTVVEYNNAQFDYIVRLSGTTLTADDETVLLFLNECAIKNKSRTFTTTLKKITVGAFFVNSGINFNRSKNSLYHLNIATIDTYFSCMSKGKKISKGFSGHLVESFQYEHRELQTGYITITFDEKYYQSIISNNSISLVNRKSRAKCKSFTQKNIYTILACWGYEKLSINNLMNMTKTTQRKTDFIQRSLKPLLENISRDKKQNIFIDRENKNIVFLESESKKLTIETHQLTIETHQKHD